MRLKTFYIFFFLLPTVHCFGSTLLLLIILLDRLEVFLKIVIDSSFWEIAAAEIKCMSVFIHFILLQIY